MDQTKEKDERTKKVKRAVLQTGEGVHEHVLIAEGENEMEVTTLEREGEFNINLTEPARLEHDEHATILIKPGNYLKVPQKEYDPMDGKTRMVYD